MWTGILMKLRIKYNPDNGYLFPDGKTEEWVDKIIALFKDAVNKGEDPEWELKVCSALLIDCFRLRLAEGILTVNEIEFVFKDQTLKHNETGRIEKWPKGFCDHGVGMMEKILSAEIQAHKKSKGSNKDGQEKTQERY